MAITPFKVIQGYRCWYQWKVCDFLLLINTNLPPILHRFQIMADHWSIFSLATGEFLTLTPSLGVIPCE